VCYDALLRQAETRHAIARFIKPSVSHVVGIAMGWYQQRAWRLAAQWIKDNVECDDVRSLHLDHTVLESSTSPVYIPAYIFRSQNLGAHLPTLQPVPART
jgi:hypothetical protein